MTMSTATSPYYTEHIQLASGFYRQTSSYFVRRSHTCSYGHTIYTTQCAHCLDPAVQTISLLGNIYARTSKGRATNFRLWNQGEPGVLLLNPHVKLPYMFCLVLVGHARGRPHTTFLFSFLNLERLGDSEVYVDRSMTLTMHGCLQVACMQKCDKFSLRNLSLPSPTKFEKAYM